MSEVRGGKAHDVPLHLVHHRTLKKDRAYLELKQLIMEQAIAPGSVVSERELATRLGMSQAPIRVAVQRLELDGFVHISPQRGIIVREDSAQEVADMFDLRGALETHVARRIAGHLTPEQNLQLEGHLAAQYAAAESEDLLRFTELDADFHLLLCNFAGNQEIARVTAGLRNRLHRVIMQVLTQNPDRPMTALEEHSGIVQSLREGEAEAAAARVVLHLEYGRRRFLARGKSDSYSPTRRM